MYLKARNPVFKSVHRVKSLIVSFAYIRRKPTITFRSNHPAEKKRTKKKRANREVFIPTAVNVSLDSKRKMLFRLAVNGRHSVNIISAEAYRRW